MQVIRGLVWLGIAIAFVRGLFVFDMGMPAVETYPMAGAVCLAGSVLAGAIMYCAEKRGGKG